MTSGDEHAQHQDRRDDQHRARGVPEELISMRPSGTEERGWLDLHLVPDAAIRVRCCCFHVGG
jgi:hypothetical protein